jgi:hypothetical protein
MANPRRPRNTSLSYYNPAAMIAYYFAVVSLLRLIGLPFGIAAFFLGIGGLRATGKSRRRGARFLPALVSSSEAGRWFFGWPRSFSSQCVLKSSCER